MRNILKKKKELFIIIINAMFFATAGNSGYATTNDSPGYTTPSFIREPVYSLFLAAVRKLSHADDYLNTAVMVQTILAIIAVSIMIIYLVHRFELSWPLVILVQCLAWIPYIVGSMRENSVLYTHYILTEGITFSIFYLLFCCILEVILYSSRKAFVMTCFLSLVLALTRSHLKFLLGIVILIAVIMAFRYKKWLTWGGGGITVAVVCLLLITPINKIYYSNTFGTALTPKLSSVTLLANTLYLCDEGDAKLIGDEGEKKLFLATISQMRDKQYLSEYHGEGLIATARHLSGSHAQLKIHIYQPFAQAYLEGKGIDNSYEINVQMGAVSKELFKELFPTHIIGWLYDFFSLFLMGMANSVFLLYPPFIEICYLIAFMLYIAAGILMGYCFKEDKGNRTAYFMLAVLLILVCNVVICSATIYAITRYILYTEGLFYIAFILLIREACRIRKGRKTI